MEEFAKALRDLWVGKGEDWMGLRTGIVAGTEGVEVLVGKLDEVVRGFAVGDTETDGGHGQLHGGADGVRDLQQSQTQAQTQAEGKDKDQDIVVLD